MNRADYPPNWEAIRAQLARLSGNRCEAQRFDGSRCAAPNHTWIHRGDENREYWELCAAEGPDCTNRDVYENGNGFYNLREGKPIYVVLTAAHTCRDSHCDDLDHIRHWCQLHHLRYDAKQHGQKARETRFRKRGQLALALSLVLLFAMVLPRTAQAQFTPNPDLVRVTVNRFGYYEIWLNDHRLFFYDWNGKLHVAQLDDRERYGLIDALEHPTR